jgi:hypothetical protein
MLAAVAERLPPPIDRLKRESQPSPRPLGAYETRAQPLRLGIKAPTILPTAAPANPPKPAPVTGGDVGNYMGIDDLTTSEEPRYGVSRWRGRC